MVFTMGFRVQIFGRRCALEPAFFFIKRQYTEQLTDKQGEQFWAVSTCQKQFMKKIRPQPDFFRFCLRGYRLKNFSLNVTAPCSAPAACGVSRKIPCVAVCINYSEHQMNFVVHYNYVPQRISVLNVRSCIFSIRLVSLHTDL